MQAVFIYVLNLSLRACPMIAVVLLVRLALRRAPQRYACVLWSVVWFRLIFPFGFKRALPGIGETSVPQDIGSMAAPQIATGITPLDAAVNAALPAATPAASVNPIQLWLAAVSWVWIAGVLALLLYSLVSLLTLKSRLDDAAGADGVYTLGGFSEPFVLGLFRPHIYLPEDLAGEERSAILLHERAHIRRGDPLIKAAFWIACCAHWFNPLVWLAFALLCRDMEMACDEAALARFDGSNADYAQALLRLSAGKPSARVPLAFAENSVKARVKNALRFKKPAVWVTAVCAAAVLLTGCALLSDRQETTPATTDAEQTQTAEVAAEPAAVGTGELIWPVRSGDKTDSGDVSSVLIARAFSSYHKGVDLACTTGTPIYAADTGVVTYVGDETAGYWKYIVIDHGNGLQTVYAHNSENLVAVGDVVEKGERIALVGCTGNVTGPHVHFEVRTEGSETDTFACLPSDNAPDGYETARAWQKAEAESESEQAEQK
ncbi:MAG: M56 family metallopeptidase [Oscillospiraceae bacterium]|nr:M56 family metallopeptidase [Oscillospiraceae bacterium]